MARRRKSKPRPKPKPKRFNPLAPTFKYQKGFERAVKQRAQGQVAPLLADVKQRRGETTAGHRAREEDIDRYYGYDLGARQDAYSKMNSALNSLITTNAGLSTASQQALAASLRGSAATEGQQAALLGVAPQNNPEAAIKAGAAMGDVGTLGTLGNLEAIRSDSARGIGLSGVAHREAGMSEDARFRELIKGLQGERKEIRGRIPGLRAEARSAIGQEEAAKAGQRFQQNLASDQFGFQKRESGRNYRLQKRAQGFQEKLAGRQQTETERSNRANETISMAGVRAQREQYRNQVKNAGSEAEREDAKARGERFNKGVEILTNWFAPTKQEQGKRGQMGPKRQDAYSQRLIHGYDEMLAQIMAATGMGPVEARRVILAAADRTSEWGKRWARRAESEISSIHVKRKRTKAVGPKSKLTPGPGGKSYRPT